MMAGFWASFLLILAAEMGDKTQLIALSFATRYNPWKVVAGIFSASLILFFVGAAIGDSVGAFIPYGYLKLAVGAVFIGFGLWTLRADDDGDSGARASRFGPFLTVAIAFFLAELGDKSQVAAISLAAKYHSFFGVWLGSTLGMVVGDSLAILLGVLMGKKLPAKAIRYISAGLFILFGLAFLFGLM